MVDRNELKPLSEPKPLIVALDFPNARAAMELVDKLDPESCRLKVGKELFTASGPEFVKQLIAKKFDVFLDLKFHDIPNTVGKAVAAAADLGVWMLNVHALGGRAMLHAANESLQGFGADRPLLIAVTVLTSMLKEDLLDVGIEHDPAALVLRLASLSQQSGLDGVVCSAAETTLLRARFPDDFCLVTPGIRRQQDASDDQKRIIGPAEAIKNGSDYLVIGRPITRAADPQQAISDFSSAILGVSR